MTKTIAALLFLMLAGSRPGRAAGPERLRDIKLPPGFRIEVYAADLPGARSMARSPSGVLYVGTREQGKVYAVLDADGDGGAEKTLVVARGLTEPNGVAFRNGSLYVAEIGRILRYPGLEKDITRPPAPEVVTAAYPKDREHGWKFIRFGPDGKLYVPVGAPCNVCLRSDPIYASITRLDVSGGRPEIFARGVRNTVGFDWRPGTNELWFTDNGRDRLGDDKPPDELDKAPSPGLNFGFPYFHGSSTHDPVYSKGRDHAAYRKPELDLDPHVAALGMRFYTGRMYPAKYRGGIFIAEHGSWNRTVPIGYRVTYVAIKAGKPVSYEVFAEGWLKDGHAWGRPVDVEVLPDGSMLVSDDKAGMIYRISYDGAPGTGPSKK